MIEDWSMRAVLAIGSVAIVANTLDTWAGIAPHWAALLGLPAGAYVWWRYRVYEIGSRTLSDGEG